MRLLVVEDETKIARALKTGLEEEHYDVTVARTGEEGFFLISAQTFDLVLLDLMLPGRNGLEILKAMRQRGIQTPILVLTAKDAVKPFAFPELLARIRTLLRRGRPDQILRLKAADLDMDLATRKVSRNGRTLDLTGREFEILEYLLRCAGQIVTREMLARDVWKDASRDLPLDNVIDVHMTRLRRKVDLDPRKRLLHTVRGVGFVLKEDAP